MQVAIVKYNAGNTLSVSRALTRIGCASVITDDPKLLAAADKVIFPGVGEASSAMQYLKERDLDRVLVALQQPVLGICLGMQLLCTHSEEQETTCLNVFDQTPVKKFVSGDPTVKVPQVGWNQVTHLKGPLFKGVDPGSYFYFVHSYYAVITKYTTAQTDYTLAYGAAMQKNNFYGVQFHPEKSAESGRQLLQNFLAL